MEIIIKPKHNLGYHWFSSNGIHVKGFLFDEQNQLVKEGNLIHYFQNIGSVREFKEKLISANGQFAVIIQKEKEIYFAVDRTRTFPLFYSLNNQRLVVSDSALIAADGKEELSNKSIHEFLHTGYVLGQKTLLDNVFQLISGQLFHFKEEMVIESFFDYKMEREISTSPEFLEKKLKLTLDQVGKRLVKLLNGRTAVIPLSGGYDSRLVVALLQQNQYQKVICFTYGAPFSSEVKTSKKVAKQLGLPWHFVPYTQQLMKGFLNTADFQSYYPYASNYSSSFYTQDYFAVQYLKKHRLIPEDSVFIPGHSGDLLAGGNIPTNLTNDNLIPSILSKHFSLRGKYLPEFGMEIKKLFLNAQPFEEFDSWNFKERQGKFIINSNRVFEFFGYQHLIPLWDKELIDFFQNVDLQFKLHQNLYNKVLFKYFFKPLHIAYLKPKYPFLIQKMLGGWNRLVRWTVSDPTNFKFIANEFLKDEPLDLKWNNTRVNINAVQSTWYIQKLKKKRK